MVPGRYFTVEYRFEGADTTVEGIDLRPEVPNLRSGVVIIGRTATDRNGKKRRRRSSDTENSDQRRPLNVSEVKRSFYPKMKVYSISQRKRTGRGVGGPWPAVCLRMSCGDGGGHTTFVYYRSMEYNSILSQFINTSILVKEGSRRRRDCELAATAQSAPQAGGGGPEGRNPNCGVSLRVWGTVGSKPVYRTQCPGAGGSLTVM